MVLHCNHIKPDLGLALRGCIESFATYVHLVLHDVTAR